MDTCQPDEILARHRIRATRQRLELMARIIAHDGAFCAADLAESANRSQDVATVYRFLQVLFEHGVLREVGEFERGRHYEMACVHHPEHAHFVCDRCRRVTCLAPLSFGDALQLAGHAGGRKVSRVKLEFGGLCPVCEDQEEEGK